MCVFAESGGVACFSRLIFQFVNIFFFMKMCFIQDAFKSFTVLNTSTANVFKHLIPMTDLEALNHVMIPCEIF